MNRRRRKAIGEFATDELKLAVYWCGFLLTTSNIHWYTQVHS